MHCEYQVLDDDGDLYLPMPGELGCESSPLNAFTTQDWAVNGVAGGGANVATIVPDEDRWTGKAIYTTPVTKPSQNVAAVSAQHESMVDETQYTLVANITIDAATIAANAIAGANRRRSRPVQSSIIAVDAAHRSRHR